ncbi:MAG: FadR family transcriptional regulator [Syntrophothermus sp.]|uniref:FadR/GntR family transcriptional regulator n=1 Tax=Syntrophothermus sp. TaxID=2736299 RepID=UPI002579DFFB|nr:FadR/GntR family transcriptional regulator [Syntrophothermus sp.]NSW83579.1 FadR family transcriptional regulator [Syntrophothermus sp.]
MDIRPVKRTTLPDKIAEDIKGIILEGRLKPGDKLPTERELAEQFNVGRTTIREALKALAAMGLITRTREGTIVNTDVLSFVRDPLIRKLILEHITIKELFEARRLLEVQLAGLAAERASDEDLEEIGRALKEMQEELKVPQKFINSDIAFHEAIAKAAKNKVLVELFIAVRGLLWAAQVAVVMYSPGVMERSLDYHTRIYGAIKDRRKDEAATIMEKHVSDVENSLSGVQVVDESVIWKWHEWK